MRRPFSVYQRKDHPNWWVNFRIAGERIRKDTGIARPGNETEATRKGGAIWLEECARAGVPAQPQGELATLDLLEQWVKSDLAARARKRNPRYLDQIETDIARHVVPRFEFVSMISRRSWDTAQGEMHASGLTLRSIQRTTSSLRLFLRYCEDIGAIHDAPKLRAPTGEEVGVEQQERSPLTRAERDRFLAALRKLDARAGRIYAFMFYTLLRKSTVEKILPRWVNYRTGYLHFPPGAIKSRKAKRAIWLHPKAREAARAELASRARISPEEPIFGAFDYRELFPRALAAARIRVRPGLVPHHVTRHTGATLAAEDGATLVQLMALGLWETASQAQRYMHVDAKHSRKAAERL